MHHDPLDVMAASYKTIADTQQLLAQTQLRMEGTRRLGLRVQAFAIALLGLSLAGAGFLVWQHLAMGQESAELNQAVLTNTQTIAAQTQAIMERLRP